MKRSLYLLILILLLPGQAANVTAAMAQKHAEPTLAVTAVSAAENPPPSLPGQDSSPPVFEKIAPSTFRLGTIHIDLTKSQVEFPARINMTEGLLEYLLVAEGGKIHESLLITSVQPYDLQVSLLLLGLKGSSNPLSEQGDTRAPTGDAVRIDVRPAESDAGDAVPVSRWLMHKDSGLIKQPVGWVFTGSIISNGTFLAQLEKSIVAIFRDPVAMIDNPMPEGANDEIWLPNTRAMPSVGTEVILIIRKNSGGRP